jgi:hypothetical protein
MTIKENIKNFLTTHFTSNTYKLQFPSENVKLPPVVGADGKVVENNYTFDMNNSSINPIFLQIIIVLGIFIGIIGFINISGIKLGKILYELHEKLDFKSLGSYFNKVIPRVN